MHSVTVMSCGIHMCPRKCHNHKDPACLERVKTEFSCGHSVSRKCHQSKESSDVCFTCKLAKQKAEADKATDENEAGTIDRPSQSPSPSPSGDSSVPTSPTSPWRFRPDITTTSIRGLRGGRGHSTNVFAMRRGAYRSTDTYRDGLFSRPKSSQSDSSGSSRGGSSRGGSWRSTSRW